MLKLVASRGFAPRLPVSETGALLIMQRRSLKCREESQKCRLKHRRPDKGHTSESAKRRFGLCTTGCIRPGRQRDIRLLPRRAILKMQKTRLRAGLPTGLRRIAPVNACRNHRAKKGAVIDRLRAVPSRLANQR